jgi:endogenous inhibitor of DNA gyrase (YacG/DUF329 family)
MACPICSKPTLKDYTPFCSRRCADVDLSRWLKGSYAIPGSGVGDEEGDGQAPANSRENNGVGGQTKRMDSE